MPLPSYVKIVEVGPRDGLQNEKETIATNIKIDFINQLSETGLSVIEATSFVSPKWIPQFADASEVFQNITKKEKISYPVLIPNLVGFKNALKVGVKEIAVFTTPSETFSKKNTNSSVKESITRIKEIMNLAHQENIKVRGYLSCVLGCPYEGDISVASVADLALQLIELGCYEISLGDTIGVGTPLKTKQLIEQVSKNIPLNQLAVHFHDTYGQALANIFAALELGIATVDSSIAGLGGCPYAKGATGNVATEEVLYMLNGMNIKTNVDFQAILNVAKFILQYVPKKRSKVLEACSP